MITQHKCKVTVLEAKVFSDLQEKCLADPQSAPYLLFVRRGIARCYVLFDS